MPEGAPVCGALINSSASAITGPQDRRHPRQLRPGETVSATVTITPRPSILQGYVTDTSHKPIPQTGVYIAGSQPIVAGEVFASVDAGGIEFVRAFEQRGITIGARPAKGILPGLTILPTPRTYLASGEDPIPPPEARITSP